MPERGFSSETWDSDEWFQDLSRDQRYLFIYLWTNAHCNQAGLYRITLTTIANEARFAKEELSDLLHSLKPKVIWYPAENLVWVKNFLKRQSKSSKFLAAAAKCLTSIHSNGIIDEFLRYNLERYNISIPYQYYINKISILTRASDTLSNTDTNTDGGGEGVSNYVKIFEENIGVIATPIMAERFRDISERFTDEWFKEACIEAATSGARNLNYVEAILERWKIDGFKSKRKISSARKSIVPTTAELKAQAERKGLSDGG